ncbi:MAG: cell division protein ZapA [Desulfobacteraceae bacterium]|nr:cell division protein ZapA [Desulfobacteraceae bacterium]
MKPGTPLSLDQLVTIELFGHPFTFKVEDNAAEAKAVADFFAREVGRIEAQYSDDVTKVDKRAVLILTALNITNDYLKIQKKYRSLLKNISDRSNSLINLLDTRDQ